MLEVLPAPEADFDQDIVDLTLGFEPDRDDVGFIRDVHSTFESVAQASDSRLTKFNIRFPESSGTQLKIEAIHEDTVDPLVRIGHAMCALSAKSEGLSAELQYRADDNYTAEHLFEWSYTNRGDEIDGVIQLEPRVTRNSLKAFHEHIFGPDTHKHTARLWHTFADGIEAKTDPDDIDFVSSMDAEGGEYDLPLHVHLESIGVEDFLKLVDEKSVRVHGESSEVLQRYCAAIKRVKATYPHGVIEPLMPEDPAIIGEVSENSNTYVDIIDGVAQVSRGTIAKIIVPDSGPVAIQRSQKAMATRIFNQVVFPSRDARKTMPVDQFIATANRDDFYFAGEATEKAYEDDVLPLVQAEADVAHFFRVKTH